MLFFTRTRLHMTRLTVYWQMKKFMTRLKLIVEECDKEKLKEQEEMGKEGAFPDHTRANRTGLVLRGAHR